MGRVEEVAGTGVRFFVGGDALTAGNYTLTLGTYGQTHGDNFALQRAVMGAAVLTRAIQRNGSTLPIVRFAKIARTLRGGAQFSGQMTLEFVPASAYWLADSRSVTVEGQQVVHVGGMSRASLRVTFTGPVIDPYIVTPAGTTRWIGTVPAGADLVIDARPGRWTVTLSGAAAQLRLQGPQPYLCLLYTSPSPRD